MASLIGAIRSSTGDPWWIFKLTFSLFVLYFTIEKTTALKSIEAQITIYAIVGLFFLGAASVTMSRNIGNLYPLFPGIFNIHDIIVKAFGSILSLLPGCVITAGIIIFVNTLNLETAVNYIIYTFTGLMMIPFILIPLVLYSARGKISDAFRMSLISFGAGNFIMSIMILILEIAAIFGIAAVCIYFFLVQMFSAEHISINILIYVFSIITFFHIAIYISDLYDDIIPSVETDKTKEEDF